MAITNHANWDNHMLRKQTMERLLDHFSSTTRYAQHGSGGFIYFADEACELLRRVHVERGLS
jgi:hypothetical protein